MNTKLPKDEIKYLFQQTYQMCPVHKKFQNIATN